MLAGLGALATGQARAGAPETSPWPVPRGADFSRRAVSPAESLIERANLGGKLSYVVADGRTGTVLEAKNPLLPMPPASVAKAVTAIYALDTLGPDYTFKTRVLATGPVVDGRLNGDLVLVGGGDPMLNTDGLAELAAALRATGLREISGRFRVYAGQLPFQRMIDREQPEQVGYNPAVSGLNLNYNRVYFEWKQEPSGYSVSMDARSEKYRPVVAMTRMRVVNRQSPVYTYRQDGAVERWTVASGALGKGGGRWLPVRQPGLYTAQVFQWLARTQGIALPDPKEMRSPPRGTEIASYASENLSEIVRVMLKYSINLIAEVLGLTTARARGARPMTLKASAGEMNRWAKQNLGTKRAKLSDHSGLSDTSRLSASDMVKVLRRSEGRLRGLMKEVVPVDVNGRKNPDAGHRIRAKTGSLYFVSSLAGYVETPGGNPLIFAVFTGDLPRRAALTRESRERPKGARDWSRRSRWLQHQLIDRWARLYDR